MLARRGRQVWSLMLSSHRLTRRPSRERSRVPVSGTHGHPVNAHARHRSMRSCLGAGWRVASAQSVNRAAIERKRVDSHGGVVDVVHRDL
jgi:hypothetical protein